MAGLTKFMNAMFAWAPGGLEIVLILVVILVLFGAKKIPELARGLGTGIKEFKKATREVTDEIQNTTTDTPPAAKPAPPAPSRADLPGSQSSNPPKA
jgi:sec-independent protein translocase protein TatA